MSCKTKQSKNLIESFSLCALFFTLVNRSRLFIYHLLAIDLLILLDHLWFMYFSFTACSSSFNFFVRVALNIVVHFSIKLNIYGMTRDYFAIACFNHSLTNCRSHNIYWLVIRRFIIACNFSWLNNIAINIMKTN